jgi:hypothetical protein
MARLLLGNPLRSELAQLLVHRRQQPVSRVRIAQPSF